MPSTSASDGQAHYGHGGYRYEVSDEDLKSLSHFLHFDPMAAVPVNACCLNIFTEGTPLAPLPLPDGGAEPPGPAADLDVQPEAAHPEDEQGGTQ